MTRLSLGAVSLVAGLLLAGCDNNNSRSPGPPPPDPDPMTPRSVSEIVNDEIANNTRDDAEPIQINDLPVTDDRTETEDPSPL